MAVITLAQYKALMGVTSTDSTRDARITALIPIIEDDITAYCSRDFLNDEVNFSGYFVVDETSGTYTLTCALGGITDTDLAVGDCILLEGTVRNDGRYTISVLTDTVITTTEALVDESSVLAEVTLIQWPLGTRGIAARMIAYQLKHGDDAGLTGETIKSYSYSRASSGADAGYPAEILKGLDRWRYVKTGSGQRRGHYIDHRGSFVGEVI